MRARERRRVESRREGEKREGRRNGGGERGREAATGDLSIPRDESGTGMCSAADTSLGPALVEEEQKEERKER